MAEFSKWVENIVRKGEIALSNISFSHSAFKGFVQQTHKKQGLFGKGLRAGQSLAWPIFFPRIDDSHCSLFRFITLSSLLIASTMVISLRKQPVACKEHCTKYLLKELHDSMDRYTGHCDITEILLKTALNNNQSICKIL